MPGPRKLALALVFAVSAALALPALASAQTPDAKVSVAGPITPYLPNAVNEPALAIDANHPSVLAAGANDLVDSAPCNGSSCDLTPDIGISGIYFSLNEGATWVQPTYSGLTAQSGTPHEGPWGTAVARNITSSKEYGIGDWSDESIRRAITQGLAADGRRLVSPMASRTPSWAGLTAQDLHSLLAYLRSLPPLEP